MRVPVLLQAALEPMVVKHEADTQLGAKVVLLVLLQAAI
jgi:hypothetical protein